MRDIDEKFVDNLLNWYCTLRDTSGLGFAKMLRAMEFTNEEREEIYRILSEQYGLGMRRGTK